MHRISRIVKHLVTDPNSYMQSRLTILNKPLGSLSLGYSGGDTVTLHFTKFVGQEGCIDWNVMDLFSKMKTAIAQKKFTPDIINIMQDLSNELMPGYTMDWLKAHWFIRPYTSGNKIGFCITISGSTPSSLLGDNLISLIPLSGILIRGFNEQMSIGEININLFMIGKTNLTIYSQLSISFLFDPFISKKINLSSSLLQLNNNNSNNIDNNNNNNEHNHLLTNLNSSHILKNNHSSSTQLISSYTPSNQYHQLSWLQWISAGIASVAMSISAIHKMPRINIPM